MLMSSCGNDTMSVCMLAANNRSVMANMGSSDFPGHLKGVGFEWRPLWAEPLDPVLTWWLIPKEAQRVQVPSL